MNTKHTPLDLTTFEFPKRFYRNEYAPLLEEAKKRGFYNGHTEYNRLFSTLFFSGGQIDFKKDVDPEFKAKAWPFCRAFMQSWEPKHEEKEAICAMLMSELIEPNLVKAEKK